jgi:hypothetical protein
MSRPYLGKRITISLRLPEVLYKRLKDQAEDEHRTIQKQIIYMLIKNKPLKERNAAKTAFYPDLHPEDH